MNIKPIRLLQSPDISVCKPQDASLGKQVAHLRISSLQKVQLDELFEKSKGRLFQHPGKEESILQKIFCNVAIGLIMPIVAFFDVLDWIKNQFVVSPVKEFHEALRVQVQKEDHRGIYRIFYKKLKEHRSELISKYPEISKYHFFLDILAAKEIRHLLPEILRGANMQLVGDDGEFYRRWLKMEGVYKRISSHHHHQKGHCHGINGDTPNELLFWIDKKHLDTRFQIEKSSLKGPFGGIPNKLRHLVDFLRYRRDGEQQGIFGTSPYTDQHCLKVHIDKKRFKARRKRLLSSGF